MPKKIIAAAAVVIAAAAVVVAFLMTRRPELAPSAPGPLTNAGAQAVEPLPPPLPAAQGDAYAAKTVPEADMKYAEDRVPLAQVPNLKAVKEKYGLHLTPEQEAYLSENRFLLVDRDQASFGGAYSFDDMLADFDRTGGGLQAADRAPEDARLITPDVVLHAYHKFFEMTLERLEQKELSDDLGAFLRDIHANIAAAAARSSGALKERYQNLEAQIVVARVLFENKSGPKPAYFPTPDAEKAYADGDAKADAPARAKELLAKIGADLPPALMRAAGEDLAAIYAADGVGKSPLFAQYNDDLRTDYTQYGPRSHYAKNSVLRAYFRTMMYLGRSSWFLKKDVGVVDASLLTSLFTVKNPEGGVPLDAWKKIMSVTGFYAGQSDDLGYGEWRAYVVKTLGEAPTDAALADPANVKKLADGLAGLRMPMILSDVLVSPEIPGKDKAQLLRETLAYRVFGQRFTFDAWVLNDLTAGQEKTEVRLPSTPSALFVPAAFGDARAAAHAGEFLRKDAGFTDDEVKGFGGKLDAKKADIARVKKDEWFGSMGSAWLYVLGSLTQAYGAGYPSYMRTVAFLDKQIQTFLGSYAALKHDTLLYAKQSYAELGGGPGSDATPPVVKGFVEPNLAFWNRFNELLDRTDATFAANGLFADGPVRGRMDEFKRDARFFADLAEKELRGAAISEEEYEKLRTIRLSFMAEPFDADQPDEKSGRVALIADVHTDALRQQILYEADGKPYLMLAIVGNEGSPRVVAGVAYSHFELTGPLGKRLTDEDWRGRVYDGQVPAPERNFWYDSLSPKR